MFSLSSITDILYVFAELSHQPGQSIAMDPVPDRKPSFHRPQRLHGQGFSSVCLVPCLSPFLPNEPGSQCVPGTQPAPGRRSPSQPLSKVSHFSSRSHRGAFAHAPRQTHFRGAVFWPLQLALTS